MEITVGKSRKDTNWKKTEMSFEELKQKVSKPIQTAETYNEFLSYGKEGKDEAKDAGGFILGTLKGPRRKKDEVISRSGVALDADNIPSYDELENIIDSLNYLSQRENFGFEYCVYSTRKYTKDKPRIRILIPLKETIESEKYEPIVRKLTMMIGMDFFDPTGVEAHRLMYWPTLSRDINPANDNYFFYCEGGNKGDRLDPEEILSLYTDWQDTRCWPLYSRETERVLNEKNRQEDPLSKEGIIGQFCRTYSIQDVIESYLPDVYEPAGEDRYTYLNGSTAAGAVIYDDKFIFSHHATDPAGDMLCNAFDLVRVHKFGDTKVSLKKMEELAYSDEKVLQTKAAEDAKGLSELHSYIESTGGFEPEKEEKTDDEIRQELLASLTRDERNKAKPASSIDNVLKILRQEPFLNDSYYYDSFADKVRITKVMPWPCSSEERNWKDSDDAGLRWLLETYYQIKGKETIMDALEMSFEERAFHPIKDYLENLTWDGKERVDTLLIDYFGAEDNVYTRDVMRKALVAAVTRIYEPGAKYDTMPILVGSQGVGKSTFIAKLGRDWFSDSVTDFAGKESYELLQNNWLIEIPELNGFSKYEMNQIKHFLSKQIDEYRAPYKRRKESHPRQCVFFGTTNDQVFLRDKTGNRRFWPVQLGVNKPTKSVFTDLDDEIDQIWAESYVIYQLGEKLYLEGESKEISELEQQSRLEEDPREGMIVEFIKRPIPEDWHTWSIEERRAYWSNPNDFSDINLVTRKTICAAEIICELFNEEIGRVDKRRSREINGILEGLPGAGKIRKAARYGKGYKPQRGGYEIDPDLL